MKLKKRIMTLDELNAYRVAYGKPIQRKEFLLSIAVPFIVCAGFVFLLFYYWWLALIAGCIGVVYSYIVIIPQQVKRVYEDNAFRERNNFVNNMTQILTNDERTVLQALKTVSDRAKGEFREDLIKLQANLLDASNKDIHIAFQDFGEKYSKDIIFSLYVEQLTTAVLEGRTSMETIKDIKTYHNEIKKRQEKFFFSKKQHAKDFRFTGKVAAIFIGAITLSFGFRQFIEVYAHHPIGWIFNIVYLVVIAKVFHTFTKRMSDDSVMEVKI